MKRLTLVGSVAASLCLGLAAPLLAAEPAATTTVNRSAPGDQNATAMKPATECLSDLRAFDARMSKDGYWLGASGYGYGYPMGGYGGFGYGYGVPLGGHPAALIGDHPVEAGIGDHPAATAAGYHDVRPGYEIRILVASANILARHGQQQACEKVLATTRDTYKLYVADMHSGRVPVADGTRWRQQQIAAAKSVTDKNISLRSDELIGIEVRDPKDQALGSVDDLVMSPKTGKIAYLVIARGGIFGIGEKYVPVPWSAFKVTPTVSLLVLDATTGTMAAAPEVNYERFASHGHFDRQSQKVDAYWKTHLSNISIGASKG
ncbi:MAG TPA: PRC-barrel domain-containing protein [Stellaceae bacterium]|jgi:sporulation protein YlmC with PRC-barrel domain|nr:PRC-barrel domain-containing protein [Stellaceae bacterium]